MYGCVTHVLASLDVQVTALDTCLALIATRLATTHMGCALQHITFVDVYASQHTWLVKPYMSVAEIDAQIQVTTRGGHGHGWISWNAHVDVDVDGC